MTESFDRPSGNNNATGLSVEGSRVLQPVAGSTGNKTATAAAEADAGNAHLVALRPAKASLAISTPTGTASNDVMVAAIGFNNSSAAITPPAGWTLVRRLENTATTSNSLAVYRKTAAAGEPGSHTWAVAGGAFVVGGIQSFSGVDTANPIDTESGQATASATAHDTPSITTTSANTMLVTAHTYASSQSWTLQAGLSESFDRLSGSANATGQSITGGRQAQPAAGASGTKRATAASSADRGNTHILALRRLIPNAPPTVSLTSPSNGASFAAPASIPLSANAADSDGTIQKVEFFHGGTNLVATVTSAPYTFNWSAVGIGSYTVTAVATDNQNATTTSAPINVTVVNSAPSVSITSPTPGASFLAPANVQITASVADPDGSIQQVEFFHGGTNLITTITTSPYSFTWGGVPQGTYTLTAVATDNDNASTTSMPVNLTVRTAALHFIHVDHLNTPRLVANLEGQPVWRWAQQEPFGDNAPDENPSGFGSAEFPLRFPGQYADKETNFFYNYFRDFDAGLGRYVESDPIGIRGGLNTYAYVGGNPLWYSDPFGEEWQITMGLGGTYGFGWGASFGRFYGWAVNLQLALSECTWQVNLQSQATKGKGFGGFVGAGGQISAAYSAAPTTAGIQQSYTTGGEAGFGKAVGGQYQFGSSMAGGGTGLGGKLGGGFGLAAYIGETQTLTQPIFAIPNPIGYLMNKCNPQVSAACQQD
jgi:RHS repeat-associated protein